MDDFLTSSAKASSGGGYRAVTKVRGRLTEIKPPAPSRFEGGDLQVEIHLKEAAILEMLPGEEPFDLKDNEFVLWEGYGLKPEEVVAGKRPHQNSTFVRCFVMSAEELWFNRYKANGGTLAFDAWRKDDTLRKGPRELIGEMVTLAKVPRVLFKTDKGEDNKPLGEVNGKKVTRDVLAVDKQGRPNHYSFVADEAANPGQIEEEIKKTIVGLRTSVALRELLLNPRFIQYPKYAQKAENDPEGLATDLGLVIKGDTYATN